MQQLGSGGVTLQGANAWAEENAEDSDSAEAEAPAPKPASKPKKPPAAEVTRLCLSPARSDFLH